jgi:hypothetical protein
MDDGYLEDIRQFLENTFRRKQILRDPVPLGVTRLRVWALRLEAIGAMTWRGLLEQGYTAYDGVLCGLYDDMVLDVSICTT